MREAREFQRLTGVSSSPLNERRRRKSARRSPAARRSWRDRRRSRPRWPACHCSRLEPLSTAWITGQSASSSTLPASRRAEKAVVFKMTSGLPSTSQFGERRGRLLVLEARDVGAGDAKAARRERVGERRDRQRVGGKKRRTVEKNERVRRAGDRACARKTGGPSRRAGLEQAEGRNRARLAPGVKAAPPDAR